MKNEKITIISLMVLIALATIGFTYALLSQTLTISGTATTGELEWEFKSPYGCMDGPGGLDYNANCSWDWWQVDKDVGGPTVVTPIDTDGDGHYDKLNVTLVNVYPGYAEEISFYLHNCGTIPLIFEKIVINDEIEIYENTPMEQIFVDLDDDGYNDVKLRWGNHIGIQYEPCTSKEESFSILVLQNEYNEGKTLTLIIELVAVQWNGYVAP